MNHTPGSIALTLGVLIVAGFAIAGLSGWVEPAVGAAVGLGAQVIGTVAFFMTYYIGRGDSEAASAGPTPIPPWDSGRGSPPAPRLGPTPPSGR